MVTWNKYSKNFTSSTTWTNRIFGSALHFDVTFRHFEDFDSLLWTNERGPTWVMIVFSPISDKNFDDDSDVGDFMMVID